MGQSQYDVIVSSTFSPTISDAQKKIEQKAEINDTSKNVTEVTYNISVPAYRYQFEPDPINAPKVGRDKIHRLYRNYIKFGFGNYLTPYLDFEANSLRSTKYAFGVKIFHHSSWGKIKTYAPAGFSDSRVNIYGERYFKNYILSASMSYNHLLAHCYGFQPDSVFSFDKTNEENIKINGKDILRQYHHANGELFYRSSADINKHKFNQLYAIKYNFLADNNKNTYEHDIQAYTDLNKDVEIKKFTYINFGGRLGMDYRHNRWQNQHLADYWIINLNPHAAFQYKEYYLKVGFDMALSTEPSWGNDTIKTTRFHFFPDIEARLNIVPNIFAIYARFDGGIYHDNYYKNIEENPYLSNELRLGFIDQKSRFYLGLQTSISRSLTIGAGASFAFYGALPYFINDTAQLFNYKDTALFIGNTYTIIYDKSKVLNAHFDMNYKYKDMLNLGLNIDYNHFITSENLLKPWYKPALEIKLDAQYVLLKKFVFKLGFDIDAFMYRPEFIENNVGYIAMTPIFDFDFGFEYLWSKRFSIFANFNNFPCQRNLNYFNYPNHRINVLFGLKYTFGGESLTKKK